MGIKITWSTIKSAHSLKEEMSFLLKADKQF